MDIIQTAEKEIGTTSDINGTVNPRLLAYCEKLDISYKPGDDGLWCAMFVGYVLETCGIHSTRSLSARSYLDWGVAAAFPQPGDVVVLWRDAIDSPNGHVGFFDHVTDDMIYLLGGNQGTGIVDIEGYPKSRVLDYRRAIIGNEEKTNMNNNEQNQKAVDAMDITTETPQLIKLETATVTYTKTVNGEVLSNWQIEIPLTDEMVAAVKAQQAPEFNITVER